MKGNVREKRNPKTQAIPARIGEETAIDIFRFVHWGRYSSVLSGTKNQ